MTVAVRRARANPTARSPTRKDRMGPTITTAPGKPYGRGRTSRRISPTPPPQPRRPIGTGEPGPPGLGVLEMHPKGFGFLRNPKLHYAATADRSLRARPARRQVRPARRAADRRPDRGDTARAPARGWSTSRQIEGQAPDHFPHRNFDDLTPIDPPEQVVLETGGQPLTTRVMDLLTPIGKGQRGLIVAPPRTGKTVLLQHIAAAVTANHPEMHLMVLLVDERPEEVTDMSRTVKGEVIASQLRPRHGQPRPHRRAGDGAGQAAGRAGQAGVRAARQPDAAGPGLQQDLATAAGR